MPTGPKGEKRSTDEVANALWIAKVATGQVEDVYEDGYEKPSKKKRRIYPPETEDQTS